MSSPIFSRTLSKSFWILVPASATAVMSFFFPEPLFSFDGLRDGLRSMNEATFKVVLWRGVIVAMVLIAGFFEKRRRDGLKSLAQELGYTFQAV